MVSMTLRNNETFTTPSLNAGLWRPSDIYETKFSYKLIICTITSLLFFQQKTYLITLDGYIAIEQKTENITSFSKPDDSIIIRQ